MHDALHVHTPSIETASCIGFYNRTLHLSCNDAMSDDKVCFVIAPDLSLIWGPLRESNLHGVFLRTDSPSQVNTGLSGCLIRLPCGLTIDVSFQDLAERVL